MGRKLYVGNLTYGVTDAALQQMFEEGLRQVFSLNTAKTSLTDK